MHVVLTSDFSAFKVILVGFWLIFVLKNAINDLLVQNFVRNLLEKNIFLTDINIC